MGERDIMQEQLIIDNHNLVYHVLKKMNLYNQLDEYYDIAIIGLIKAAKGYDETKKIKFTTFASTCIKNELLCYLRFHKKRNLVNNALSLDEVVYQSSNGEDIFLRDKIPGNVNIEKEIIISDQIEKLYKVISTLSQNEKFILEYSYGLNNKLVLTQCQLAELTGMSQANVCRVRKKVLIKIKEGLKRYGYVCDTEHKK